MTDKKDAREGRDRELDALLQPLRENLDQISRPYMSAWQTAVRRELAKPGKKPRGKIFTWQSIILLAAGILLGFSLGAMAFRHQAFAPSDKAGQENVATSATVQYLSAKAEE